MPNLHHLCFLSALCLASGAAHAQTTVAPDPSKNATVAVAPDAASAPASDAELEALAGGQNTVTALSEQDLTAINTGNRIEAGTVGSGAISMSGSALSGFSGIGNFVMNTGHNNNLQGSINVTIVVTQ
jgi:hypothetical protein